MRVKLKVLEGLHRGKEFEITMPQCIVGRGQECDLKPVSPAVSRQHCAIQVMGGSVVVHDLHSRNGTFVNGERIEGHRALRPGDKLQIGPLVFEIVIEHGVGGKKKTRVKSIKEAAERTVSENLNGATVDENDVSDWLDEADRMERERRLDFPETLVFQLEETREASLRNVSEQRSKINAAQSQETKKMGSGKTPDRLPRRAHTVAGDSSQAAAEALRALFGSG